MDDEKWICDFERSREKLTGEKLTEPICLEIKEECRSCWGTGLYHGFAEPEGVAVVCLNCGGKGWILHKYNEFTGRKKKPGIKKIFFSQGLFIPTGVGAIGSEMTYEEFEKKMEIKEDW